MTDDREETFGKVLSGFASVRNVRASRRAFDTPCRTNAQVQLRNSNNTQSAIYNIENVL